MIEGFEVYTAHEFSAHYPIGVNIRMGQRKVKRRKYQKTTSAAQLFEDLLSGNTGNPTLVKGAVSKASGLFRGTAQEDAQEFLRWFLEGNLHSYHLFSINESSSA